MPLGMHDAEGRAGYFALRHYPYPISDPISPTWEMLHELEVKDLREARESSRRRAPGSMRKRKEPGALRTA